LNEAAENATEKSKKEINNQNFLPLSNFSTIPIREIKGNTSTVILKDSGKFFKSISNKKNTVSFMKYGNYHNSTITAGGIFKGKTIPQRKWLITKINETIKNNFFNNLKKEMKKK